MQELPTELRMHFTRIVSSGSNMNFLQNSVQPTISLLTGGLSVFFEAMGLYLQVLPCTSITW